MQFLPIKIITLRSHEFYKLNSNEIIRLVIGC